jgi:exodeoxyribonuclease III
MAIKIATWNVNSIRARIDLVIRWIEGESPDILCLQELKVQNDLFPREAFDEIGYHVALNGQKTWNGVAVISKSPPDEVVLDLPGGFLEDQKRAITVRFGNISIINVYVPNGGDVNNERFQEKLQFLDHLRIYADSVSKRGPLILLGDFNVAPGEDDVHDPDSLDGSVCFHPLERERISRIMADGMVDLYRKFNPDGKAYSWWDYRAASFRRNLGMRLDLVLLNGSAEELASKCWIDVEPRKWQKPSDHTPVVLELE